MKQGYRYSVAGAGLSMILGFFLPWIGRDTLSLSGFSLAVPGYFYLAAIPLCGVAAICLLFKRQIQRPAYLLYPGMAGLLTLVLFIASLCFSDTGALQGQWPPDGSMEVLRLNRESGPLGLDPVRDMGLGLILTLAGIGILGLVPVVFKSVYRQPFENATDSYQSIIREKPVGLEYKRAGLVFLSLSVLLVTWVWCGVSPFKLWENRGNAKAYLFGREMSESDFADIREQRQRGPMIEAAGRAEEYMSHKYREVPFSKQPAAKEKAAEREQMTAEFLEKMTEAEKKEFENRAEKNILKQKKGGYFPPETSLLKIKGYMTALIETIAIAIWGTLLALICAVPISFFAAKNTLRLIFSSDDMTSRSMRAGISFGVRRFLDSCRGFNEFVMALIFVAVIGLGPYAGILALWIHTFGILGKVFSEQIEAIESGQVEALTSTGGSAAQTIAFSVMPQVLPGFVSYTLLRFESNVRSAAILGFVGAGGIGFLIFDKLNGYLFREVCTMMIIIIITVGIIDHFCARIRMKFI